MGKWGINKVLGLQMDIRGLSGGDKNVLKLASGDGWTAV